jgi:hypothetical protein
VEGARRVLHSAHEQAGEPRPVGEVGLGDSLAAAPAADQMDDAVDLAEPRRHRVGPCVRGRAVEQINGIRLDLPASLADLADQGLCRIQGTVGGHDNRASSRQSADDGGSRPTAGSGHHNDGTLEAHKAPAVMPRVDSMTSPSLRRSAS